jgi:hypothetical protein
MFENKNRTQVTETHLERTHEMLMEPAELMHHLVTAAAELHELGATADSPKTKLFTKAIVAVALELDMENTDVDEILAALDTWREGTIRQEEGGIVIDKSQLLLPIDGKEAISVIVTLVHTMARMPAEKRFVVANLIDLLLIFWGIYELVD